MSGAVAAAVRSAPPSQLSSRNLELLQSAFDELALDAARGSSDSSSNSNSNGSSDGGAAQLARVKPLLQLIVSYMGLDSHAIVLAMAPVLRTSQQMPVAPQRTGALGSGHSLHLGSSSATVSDVAVSATLPAEQCGVDLLCWAFDVDADVWYRLPACDAPARAANRYRSDFGAPRRAQRRTLHARFAPGWDPLPRVAAGVAVPVPSPPGRGARPTAWRVVFPTANRALDVSLPTPDAQRNVSAAMAALATRTRQLSPLLAPSGHLPAHDDTKRALANAASAFAAPGGSAVKPSGPPATAPLPLLPVVRQRNWRCAIPLDSPADGPPLGPVQPVELPPPAVRFPCPTLAGFAREDSQLMAAAATERAYTPNRGAAVTNASIVHYRDLAVVVAGALVRPTDPSSGLASRLGAVPIRPLPPPRIAPQRAPPGALDQVVNALVTRKSNARAWAIVRRLWATSRGVAAARAVQSSAWWSAWADTAQYAVGGATPPPPRPKTTAASAATGAGAAAASVAVAAASVDHKTPASAAAAAKAAPAATTAAAASSAGAGPLAVTAGASANRAAASTAANSGGSGDGGDANDPTYQAALAGAVEAAKPLFALRNRDGSSRSERDRAKRWPRRLLWWRTPLRWTQGAVAQLDDATSHGAHRAALHTVLAALWYRNHVPLLDLLDDDDPRQRHRTKADADASYVRTVLHSLLAACQRHPAAALAWPLRFQHYAAQHAQPALHIARRDADALRLLRRDVHAAVPGTAAAAAAGAGSGSSGSEGGGTPVYPLPPPGQRVLALDKELWLARGGRYRTTPLDQLCTQPLRDDTPFGIGDWARLDRLTVGAVSVAYDRWVVACSAYVGDRVRVYDLAMQPRVTGRGGWHPLQSCVDAARRAGDPQPTTLAARLRLPPTRLNHGSSAVPTWSACTRGRLLVLHERQLWLWQLFGPPLVGPVTTGQRLERPSVGSDLVSTTPWVHRSLLDVDPRGTHSVWRALPALPAAATAVPAIANALKNATPPPLLVVADRYVLLLVAGQPTYVLDLDADPLQPAYLRAGYTVGDGDGDSSTATNSAAAAAAVARAAEQQRQRQERPWAWHAGAAFPGSEARLYAVVNT